ncbi:hypothetical protein [Brooklawnia cerclae]|uniref:Uncharacterized protein n=1 Tax=Brooklawnia cerclae TaxID=349934 RepID=A0ABX0SD06_9ACTN|nr:hypothetical protein [Brooklawnia cerclae]NIH56278.1 hypothetical protein [Brooklawnia cerclae]
MTSFDIGGDAGNSFRFDTVGDQVTGTVVDLVEQQQTDLQTGEPRTFSNGQPMMMYRVDLQTSLREPGDQFDDGKRSIFLKGSRAAESQSSLAAVLAAVKAATGTTALATGGTLTLKYIGEGVAKTRGFNPPKLYAATYQPPTVDLAGPQSVAPPVAAPATQTFQQFAQNAAQQAPTEHINYATGEVTQQATTPVQQAPAPAVPGVQLPPGITPEVLALLQAQLGAIQA